jgi:hypothetical protein
MALYVLGAAGPLVLHGTLMQPITGDFFPPEYHRAFASGASIAPSATSPTTTSSGAIAADDSDIDPAALASSWWLAFGRSLVRIANGLLGEHGIFSHFPVVILGGFGIAAVMHRHWPRTTKVLATGTLVGGIAIVIFSCAIVLSGPGNMFGPQHFIVFLPLLLFWTGAWMRREHRAIKWVMAGILLAFSAAVTIVGATDPCPRQGYDRYTVAQAISNLVRGEEPHDAAPALLAGR